jgi:Lipase (class 3)
MTDRQLANIELAAYGHPATSGGWEWFGEVAGVKFGHTFFGGASIIALPGSETVRDWILDFEALAVEHDGLGPVHKGFFTGLPEAYAAMKARPLRPRVIVIGHSKGAAAAALLCGLMALDDRPAALRVVWGEPLSGFQTLKDVLADLPQRSYRNAGDGWHDPVTDVPLRLPPLEAYTRVCPLTDVCAPPPPEDAWGLLRAHHMELYAAATPEVAIDADL